MAEKFRLVELGAYQEGAIVSKTIIDKAAGYVTFFAFAAGQGLSEHTAPFDALVQVLEGAVTVLISGQEHHLESGEAIVMPAYQPHALKSSTAMKMLLMMIKG